MEDAMTGDAVERARKDGTLGTAICAFYGYRVDQNEIDPDSGEAAAIERIVDALTAAAAEARRAAINDAVAAMVRTYPNVDPTSITYIRLIEAVSERARHATSAPETQEG